MLKTYTFIHVDPLSCIIKALICSLLWHSCSWNIFCANHSFLAIIVVWNLVWNRTLHLLCPFGRPTIKWVFLLYMSYITTVSSNVWFITYDLMISNGIIPKTTNNMRCKYNGYLHQNNIIVFTIHPNSKQAKLRFPGTVITDGSYFDYVIYSSVDLHC